MGTSGKPFGHCSLSYAYR